MTANPQPQRATANGLCSHVTLLIHTELKRASLIDTVTDIQVAHLLIIVEPIRHLAMNKRAQVTGRPPVIRTTHTTIMVVEPRVVTIVTSPQPTHRTVKRVLRVLLTQALIRGPLKHHTLATHTLSVRMNLAALPHRQDVRVSNRKCIRRRVPRYPTSRRSTTTSNRLVHRVEFV